MDFHFQTTHSAPIPLPLSSRFDCTYQTALAILFVMEPDLVHCKEAVVGNVDSGKSTLVGVLTKAQPDDGNGSARKLVFNYDHEKESGRTSSVCYEIMGFDSEGRQVNPERLDLNRNRYWDEVVKRSSKIVTFIDLCGHLKYLRTTITGMCGLAP